MNSKPALLLITLILLFSIASDRLCASEDNQQPAAAEKPQINNAQPDAYLCNDDDDEGDWEPEHVHLSYAEITNVNFETPAADKPCDVTASVKFDGDEDQDEYPNGDKVRAAKIIYIKNGNLKDKYTADMACEAEVCTGSIPGQPSGTKITFAISVTTSKCNTTTEAFEAVSPKKSAEAMVPDLPLFDDLKDIVPDDMDIMSTSYAFDKDRIYVKYSVQGKINGGTLKPPDVHFYGIKITNPDIEQSEGLMVGKLWINMPIFKEIDLRNVMRPQMILPPDPEYLDKFHETGMIVLDVGKLMSGNIKEGIIVDADPDGKVVGGNIFIGSIKRSILGKNPSNYIRIIVLTSANKTLDSFMPIPYDKSHFQQIYFRNHSYGVK